MVESLGAMQVTDILHGGLSSCCTFITESVLIDCRRLSYVEELTRATMKKLTQGMAEKNKAMAAAKSDEAKDSIVS